MNKNILNQQYANLKSREKNIDFSAAATQIAADLTGNTSGNSAFERKYNEREADKAIDWSLDMCAYLSNSRR